MPLLSASRNRFFLAVNTGFVSSGLPDERARRFYSARSGNGLYCAIVGNVVLPGGYAPNGSTAQISDHSEWHRLAGAIKVKGAKPGIQLATTWPGYQGLREFVSKTPMEEYARYRAIASSVSAEDVADLFASLDRGSRLAVSAGFQHIQLHAAHGYLFSLLVDGRIFRDSIQVHEAINRWALGLRRLGVETSLRFSLRVGVPDLDDEGRDQFLDSVASLAVDYLDASSGFYNVDKRLIYPSLGPVRDVRYDDTMILAQRHLDARFILSGGRQERREDSLPSNVYVGICRDLIADPDFLGGASGGCKSLMKCHYFSRGQTHLSCGQWSSNGTGLGDAG